MPTAAIYTIILLDCIGNIRGLNSELVNRSVNFNKPKFKCYDHIALKDNIATTSLHYLDIWETKLIEGLFAISRDEVQ